MSWSFSRPVSLCAFPCDLLLACSFSHSVQSGQDSSLAVTISQQACENFHQNITKKDELNIFSPTLKSASLKIKYHEQQNSLLKLVFINYSKKLGNKRWVFWYESCPKEMPIRKQIKNVRSQQRKISFGSVKWNIKMELSCSKLDINLFWLSLFLWYSNLRFQKQHTR